MSLQTELPIPYARHEGVPLARREPEDNTPGVLAVPDVNARTVRGHDLKTVAAPVAPGAPPPRADRAISIVVDIVTMHYVLLRGFLLATLRVPDDNLSRKCLIMRAIAPETCLSKNQLGRRFR